MLDYCRRVSFISCMLKYGVRAEDVSTKFGFDVGLAGIWHSLLLLLLHENVQIPPFLFQDRQEAAIKCEVATRIATMITLCYKSDD